MFIPCYLASLLVVGKNNMVRSVNGTSPIVMVQEDLPMPKFGRELGCTLEEAGRLGKSAPRKNGKYRY